MRDDGMVRYDMLQRFIEDEMLRKISVILGCDNDMVYVKYRASDNNNSADASAFHRDIFPQNVYHHKIPPCLTCLTYLDTTDMELIPGSHSKTKVGVLDSVGMYKNRVRVTLQPGDVLVFYSTLLHRGIFTGASPHRRLIQVFDVFPGGEAAFSKWNDKMVHVKGNEKYSDAMIGMSKYPLTSHLINWSGYFNAAMGYGECAPKGVGYLSSEGLRQRILVQEGIWQEGNKYILKREDILTAPDSFYKVFRYTCYNRQFMVHAILLILISWLTWYLVSRHVSGLVKSSKKKSRTKQ